MEILKDRTDARARSFVMQVMCPRHVPFTAGITSETDVETSESAHFVSEQVSRAGEH